MENKTGKYFKYAIGEIVLVVIGILIALQVSNWNTQRQLNKTGVKILEDIQKDLLKDIDNAKKIFNSYLIKDSLTKRVLNNKLTIEDYKDYKVIEIGQFSVWFAYWYEDFVIDTNGYFKFKEAVKDMNGQFDTLQKPLNQLYVTLRNNIEVYNERIRNTVYQNIDYLSSQKDWYHLWERQTGIFPAEMLGFYLKDPLYKNQVSRYTNDFSNLSRDVQTYRVEAIDIYHKINKLLQKPRDTSSILDLNVKRPADQEKLIGHYVLVNDLENSQQEEPFSISLEGSEVFINDGARIRPMYRHSDNYYFIPNTDSIYRVYFQDDPSMTQIEFINKKGDYLFSKVEK